MTSGKYRQGHKVLKQKKDGKISYCAFGVLCDLARKDGGPGWAREPILGRKEEGVTIFGYGNSIEAIPHVMAEYLKLTIREEAEIIDSNDGGQSGKFPRLPFSEIAKIVEKLRDEKFAAGLLGERAGLLGERKRHANRKTSV